MKYIRTKDGIYENEKCEIIINVANEKMLYVSGQLFNDFSIIKQADNIEELCDKFIYSDNVFKNVIYENYNALKILLKIRKDYIVYGAIWTDKGLIYVAKMNDKGELELL